MDFAPFAVDIAGEQPNAKGMKLNDLASEESGDNSEISEISEWRHSVMWGERIQRQSCSRIR
jgi:hypothetical protein